MATWILIANSSVAHCYTFDQKKFAEGEIRLDKIDSHYHPESRKKDGDLISDRAGYFKSGDLGHGSYENETDPKEHEAELFAKELAQKLNSACEKKDFEDLVLVSPSHFYGILNKHFSKNMHGHIKKTIQKDYTKSPIKELESHLKDYLMENKQ